MASHLNVIWKLDTDGTLSVFAGTGEKIEKLDNDEEIATAAPLYSPEYLAYDFDTGDLYFTQKGAMDESRGSLRKIKDGKLYTVSSISPNDPDLYKSIGENISSFYGRPLSLKYNKNKKLVMGIGGSFNEALGGLASLDLSTGQITKVFGNFNPNSIVQSYNENLYPASFIALSDSEFYVSNRAVVNQGLIKLNTDALGDARSERIFGGKGNTSLRCGDGEIKGETTLEDANTNLKMSLRHICSGGTVQNVDYLDLCETKGTYKLVFSQWFQGKSIESNYSHLIETEIPCSSQMQGG